VEALEHQINFAKHDKDIAERSRVALQQQYDQLSTQEVHWDTLKHTSDKLDILSSLLGAGNNEELKSLRQIRDRCHVLESEHAALQRRLKDQEAKAANSERVAAAALQSLTGAQHRASEWETRAHEHEGRLELTQTKLDQAEQMHAQLDADYSLASLQLEEQTAENRLAKVSCVFTVSWRGMFCLILRNRNVRTDYGNRLAHWSVASRACTMTWSRQDGRRPLWFPMVLGRHIHPAAMA
jgi:hypothetical protein